MRLLNRLNRIHDRTHAIYAHEGVIQIHMAWREGRKNYYQKFTSTDGGKTFESEPKVKLASQPRRAWRFA